MLTAAELAEARSVQALTLTQSASIVRPALSSDGMGGWTESTAVAATVACRVGVAKDADYRLVAGKLRERAALRITVPALTDVRTDDRLTVDGVTYQVLGIRSPETLETARICICVAE